MNRRAERADEVTNEIASGVRILKRGDVAELLGVSVVRVDQLARMGSLHKVPPLPGVSRSLGFLEGEVTALLLRRLESGAAYTGAITR